MGKEACQVPTLMKITEDIRALSVHLEAEDEEEAKEHLAVFLSAQEGLLAQKVDAYVRVERNLEAIAKARREEARHLTEMARATENSVARLKEAAKRAAERLGRDKLEGKVHTITVAKGEIPSVEITSIADLPEEFKETVISYKPKRKEIAAHFQKTGEILEGVRIAFTRRVIFR